ncbi:hypothetical protein JCM3770_002476 [Rhodotorula araucariae]
MVPLEQEQPFAASPSPLTPSMPSPSPASTRSAPFSLRPAHLGDRAPADPCAGCASASAYAQHATGDALFGPAPRSPLAPLPPPPPLRDKYGLRPEQEEVLGRMMRRVWARFGGDKLGGRGSQCPRELPPPEALHPVAGRYGQAAAHPLSLPASSPSAHSSRNRDDHSPGPYEAMHSPAASSWPDGGDSWARSPKSAAYARPARTLSRAPTQLDSPAESQRSAYRSRPPSPRSAPPSDVSGLTPPASPPTAPRHTRVADRTLTPMPSPPRALDAGAAFPALVRERPPLFRTLGWAYRPARSGARTTRAPLVDGELGADEAEWARRTGRVPDDGGTRDWWGNPVGIGGDWGRAILSPVVTETEPTHSSPALSSRSGTSLPLSSPHTRVASGRPSSVLNKSRSARLSVPPASASASAEHLSGSESSSRATSLLRYGATSHHSSGEGGDVFPPGVAYDSTALRSEFTRATSPGSDCFFLGEDASPHARGRGDPSMLQRTSDGWSTLTGSALNSRASRTNGLAESSALGPQSSNTRSPRSTDATNTADPKSRQRWPLPSDLAAVGSGLDEPVGRRAVTGKGLGSFGSADGPRFTSQGEPLSVERPAPARSLSSGTRQDGPTGGTARSPLTSAGSTQRSNGYASVASPSSREDANSRSALSSTCVDVVSTLAVADSSSPSRLSRTRTPSSGHGSFAAHNEPGYVGGYRLSTIPSSDLTSPSWNPPRSYTPGRDDSLRSSASPSPSRSSRTNSLSRNAEDLAGESPLSPASYSTAASHLASPPFTPPRNSALSPACLGEPSRTSAASLSSFGATVAGVPGSWAGALAAQPGRAPETSGTTTPRDAFATDQDPCRTPRGASALETRSEDIARWASGVPSGAEDDAEDAGRPSSPRRVRGQPITVSTPQDGGTSPAMSSTTASSSFSPGHVASRSITRSPTRPSPSRSAGSTGCRYGLISPAGVSYSAAIPSEADSATEQLDDGRDTPLSSSARGSSRRSGTSSRLPSPRGACAPSSVSVRSPELSSSFFLGETTSTIDVSSFSAPARLAGTSANTSTAIPPLAQDSPLFRPGSPASAPQHTSPSSLSPGIPAPTMDRPFEAVGPVRPSLESLTMAPRSPPLVATHTHRAGSPGHGETVSSIGRWHSPPLPAVNGSDLSSHVEDVGVEQDYRASPSLSPTDTPRDPTISPSSSPASVPPSPSAYSSSTTRRYVPHPPVKPPRRGPGPFPVPQLNEEEKRARRELRKLGRSPEWDFPLEETKSVQRKRAWEEVQAFEKERARLFKLLGDALTEQDVPILNALARLYLESSNSAVREQAVQFMRNSLQLDEDQPDMARLLALQLEEVDLEEALAWHRYAVECGPEDPERHLSLGHCLLRAGDTVGASQIFFDIAQSFIDSPYEAIALYELGQLYQQHGGTAERTQALEAHESALACLTRLKLEHPEARSGERWDELHFVEQAVLRRLQELREGKRRVVESPFTSRHGTPRATPRRSLSPASPTHSRLSSHAAPPPEARLPTRMSSAPPPRQPTSALRSASHQHVAGVASSDAEPPSCSPTVLNEARPSQPPSASARKKHRRRVDPDTARTLDTVLASLSRLSCSTPAADLVASTGALAAQVERTCAGLEHFIGEEVWQQDELHRVLDEVQRELRKLPDRLVSSAKLAAARPPDAPRPQPSQDPLQEALRKLERAKKLAT